jgi:RNA polymerase sigma-70 factor (ECF subfamily)
VGKIGRGEARALRDLYGQTAHGVQACARKILRDLSDADEIVNDVYLYVWQKASRYDATRAPVRAWLNAICWSRAIDLHRVRRRRRPLPEHPHFHSETEERGRVDDDTRSVLETNAAQSALNDLSPMQFRLLTLLYFHGHTFAEVARELRIPLGTAKSDVRRTLLRMRAVLTTYFDGRRGEAPRRLQCQVPATAITVGR